jgi:hypothetical protein
VFCSSTACHLGKECLLVEEEKWRQNAFGGYWNELVEEDGVKKNRTAQKKGRDELQMQLRRIKPPSPFSLWRVFLHQKVLKNCWRHMLVCIFLLDGERVGIKDL